MIQDAWMRLPEHHPGLELDAFVIMPNHLHGVFVLLGIPGALPLPEIVRRFKTFTAHRYRTLTGIRHRLWQGNFHDRIIRDQQELDAIRAYIESNPLQWHRDRENPDLGAE